MAAGYANGQTIEEVFKITGNLEVQSMLGTPFMTAATSGKLDNMKVLKELGADIDARSKYGTALSHTLYPNTLETNK